MLRWSASFFAPSSLDFVMLIHASFPPCWTSAFPVGAGALPDTTNRGRWRDTGKLRRIKGLVPFCDSVLVPITIAVLLHTKSFSSRQ